MDDLQQLRIQRSPVRENPKCESCVHYDGNAAAKGGACEVGTQPQLCGNGSERKFGYAPLSELGPDELDDIASPTLVGAQGAMNEFGELEKTIEMKRIVLGDEDLSMAERIYGKAISAMQKSIGYAQGVVSIHCDAHLGHGLEDSQLRAPLFLTAKSLREMHFAPRKQMKYSLEDVFTFLQGRGMHATEDDMKQLELYKSRFGPTIQAPLGTHANPTTAQIHTDMRAETAKKKPAGGGGSAPKPAAPVNRAPPRNRTPTEVMPITKALPNVTMLKAESAKPVKIDAKQRGTAMAAAITGYGSDSKPAPDVKLAKSIQNPGARGGKYWRDAKGNVHYGDKPLSVAVRNTGVLGSRGPHDIKPPGETRSLEGVTRSGKQVFGPTNEHRKHKKETLAPKDDRESARAERKKTSETHANKHVDTYKDWSDEDHADAAEIHSASADKLYKRHPTDIAHANGNAHRDLMRAHQSKSNKVEKSLGPNVTKVG